MIRRRREVVALALMTTLTAGACGGSSSKSSLPVATTVAPTSAVPTTTTPPATTATTLSSASTTPAVPGRCATRSLSAQLGDPNGTAGSVYYFLTLRNNGPATCVLEGYPGVSLVAGADGHQVGAAADRLSGPAPSVVVSTGQSARAQLRVIDPGVYPPACDITTVLGLRIYPPDNTTALYVPYSLQTCASATYHTLDLLPLTATPA